MTLIPEPTARLSRPDAASFRRAMGSFATGVAVIATQCDGELFGMTVNSVTSVSLDPLIVLACIVKGSTTGRAIMKSGRFSIAFLAHDQEHVSRRFVSKEGDRFVEGEHHFSASSMQILDGAAAWLECSLHSSVEIGDHLVIYGQVEDCGSAEQMPLVYWRGRYHLVGQPRTN